MKKTRSICDIILLLAISTVCVGASPASAQFPLRASGCEWQEGFHIDSLAQTSDNTGTHPNLVYASVLFDDGSGPAIYAGGLFRSADDHNVAGLAKWDGRSWSPAPGGGAPHNLIFSLAVLDDSGGQELFTSGLFGIDHFDGTTWTSLPASGLGNGTLVLAAGNLGGGPRLFAANAAGMAQWNGLSWSPVATNSDGQVMAMTVWNDGGGNKLYAGGNFTQIGGVAAKGIAKWNGSVWAPLGAGVTAPSTPAVVRTVLGLGAKLYAGGSFTTAGSAAAANVASWNGSAWSPLGSGIFELSRLVPFNTGSGGSILAAQGSGLAAWNGETWSSLPSPGSASQIGTLIQLDEGQGNTLFVGAQFPRVGGRSGGNFRRLQGASWTPVTGVPGGRGLDGGITSLAVHDDGSGPALYAFGQHAIPGPGSGPNFSTWLMKSTGGEWAHLGTAPAGVRETISFDDGNGPALYSSSFFANEFNQTGSLQKWNGSGWTGIALTLDIRALAEHDDGSGKALYVGGRKWMAVPTFASHIAKWDGATWSPVGEGLFNTINDLAVFDDGGGKALYAVGDFTQTGNSTPARRIAKWNGTSWSALGSGLDGPALALAVFNDGSGDALYVVGSFTDAGGVPATGIAKWNGSAWSAVGGGAAAIENIVVFNDGAGDALYVSGPFTSIGGLPIAQTARWDGAAWTQVGDGPGPRARMVVYDNGFGPTLYFGGSFSQAGGLASHNIAQFCQPGMFLDGFESGDTGGWSQVFP